MEKQLSPGEPYPTDVSEEDWTSVAPYLSVMTEDASQCRHDLREICNAQRWFMHKQAIDVSVWQSRR
jgi:hypothetical protein